MGRFGILVGGFVSAIALAIPLVSGGGIGVSAPVVADSGTATPPSATAQAEARTAASPVSATAVRTPTAPEGSVSAPESDTATPTDDLAANSAIGTDAKPWEYGEKHTAPNILPPAYLSTDPETMARVKQLEALGQSCPALSTFTTPGAPSRTSAQDVAGTTTDDLMSFAQQYNQLRYENCLPGVTKFVYDSCMEQRLFWMAESPSSDPLDAWGHIGSVRIDGVPSVGCDGNLAGGSNNTGATVATKWWDSLSHRASLYRPGKPVTGVCVALAMTHGGIDEPTSFTRAAARWTTC